jgi:hypothetical protein
MSLGQIFNQATNSKDVTFKGWTLHWNNILGMPGDCNTTYNFNILGKRLTVHSPIDTNGFQGDLLPIGLLGITGQSAVHDFTHEGEKINFALSVGLCGFGYSQADGVVKGTAEAVYFSKDGMMLKINLSIDQAKVTEHPNGLKDVSLTTTEFYLADGNYVPPVPSPKPKPTTGSVRINYDFGESAKLEIPGVFSKTVSGKGYVDIHGLNIGQTYKMKVVFNNRPEYECTLSGYNNNEVTIVPKFADLPIGSIPLNQVTIMSKCNLVVALQPAPEPASTRRLHNKTMSIYGLSIRHIELPDRIVGAV